MGAVKLLCSSTLLVASVTADHHEFEGFECSAGQQQQILDSVYKCSTSSVMLDLRQLILSSNVSLGVPMEEVVQVVPDNVPVERCLGGCHLPAHSCHPIQVRKRQVEVMLVLARWPQGELQVVCDSIQVEDHLTCGCGCEVKPEHCSKRHYYQETTCRCLCRHSEERSTCIESGRTWDHNTCTCTCPRHTWTSCSTGYVFDYSSTCSCVLISALASQGLLPALVLLSLALVAVAAGGLVLRRRNVKLKNTKVTRTPLMSQISVAEYEVRKATAEIDETSRAVRFVKGAKDFQPFSELGFMPVQTIQGDVILETSSPSSKSIDTVTASEIPELAEKS